MEASLAGQGFSSISWDTTPEEDRICFFKRDIFEKCSAAYHQMFGINQTPWPEAMPKNLKDHETDGENKWEPTTLKREKIGGLGGEGNLLKIHLPVPFPQPSILSFMEQKDYVYIILRLMKSLMSGNSHKPAEVFKFQELQERVKGENQEFQNFAQKLMIDKSSAYAFTTTGVAQYTTNIWQNRLSTVFTYPAVYEPRGTCVLIPKESVMSCTLTLEKTVLEVGKIPRMIFPANNTIQKLPRVPAKFAKRFPSDAQPREAVSRDANAIKIARNYGVDVVMSSSTLRTLAGNVGPLFKESWDIPITVSQEETPDGTKKVFYLDRPLAPKQMTAVERNILFSLYAAKFQFSCGTAKMSYFYPGSVTQLDETIYNSPNDPFSSHPSDLDHLETFGVDVSQPTSPTRSIPPASVSSAVKVTPPPATSTADSESDSDGSLVIDMDTSSPPKKGSPSTQRKIMTRSAIKAAQSTPIKNEPVVTLTKATPTASASNPAEGLLSCILQDQQKMMQDKKKKQVDDRPEDPSQYVPLRRDDNVTYRTWCLRANQSQMRLLIRTSVDAIVPAKNERRTYLIVPKLEYQPWFGAESIPLRDLYRNWIDCHVRPGCRIFRARVDAYTGDLLMGEQRDATFLAADTTFRFGAQAPASGCLQGIWALLSSLRDLDLNPGSYLLQHGPYDGMCVQVLQQAESGRFNLHSAYSAVDTSATAACQVADEWLPLDPWTILPVQRVLGRPPLTFEPHPPQPSTKKRPAKDAVLPKKKSAKKMKTQNAGK